MGRTIQKTIEDFEITGSIQINRGVLIMVINEGYGADGKRNRWSRSTGLKEKGNKRKANSMLEDLLDELRKKREEQEPSMESEPMPREETPYYKAVQDWFAYNETQVGANTHDKYKYAANHVVTYFKERGTTVQKLSSEEIAKYFVNKQKGDPKNKIKGLGARTLAAHKTVINSSLEYAMTISKAITENPAIVVKAPRKSKRLPSFYSQEQINTVFQRVQDEAIAAVVILTATFGFRRQEVLGLRWTSVDFTRNLITVNHTATKIGKKIVYENRTKSTASLRTLKIPKHVSDFLHKLSQRQQDIKSTQIYTHLQLSAKDDIADKLDAVIKIPGFES